MSSRHAQCEPVLMSSQSSSQYPEHPYRNGSPSIPQTCTSAAGRRHQRREKQSNILFSILSRQMDLQTSEPPAHYSNHVVANESNDMDIGVSELDGHGPSEDQLRVLNPCQRIFSSAVNQKLISRTQDVENPVDWRKNEEMNCMPSRDHFINCDGTDAVSSDESVHGGTGSGGDTFTGRSNSTRSTEDIVEQARNRMTRLSTDVTICSSKSESSIARSNDSPIMAASVETLSNPETLRSSICAELHRKYSMGNQDMRNIRGCTASPVDLSCKRKRVESCSIPMTRRPPTIFADNCNSVVCTTTDNSLLSATLRGRSSTFSTSSFSANTTGKSNAPDVSLLEAALRGRSSTFSIGMHPSMSNYSPYFKRNDNNAAQQCWSYTQQRVTLAKRNLNPVKSRVLERLSTMTTFALQLPEFCALPAGDQRTLLIGSMHRLLLLFMAESNLEFAVTTIQTDDDIEMEEGSEPEMIAASEKKRRRSEVPTMQFVESVQNFIGKCQAINIRPSEYFFMRWIILFHSGLVQLECRDAVTNLNTAARQDLQEIITHSHPSDKLRYSKLLLALHTAYGINCSMLEQLFCAPLCLKDGIKGFVTDLLNARNGHVGDLMFKGAQEL